MAKRWIEPDALETDEMQRQASELGVHPVIARLLAARKISGEDARAFFDPQWEGGVHDPFLFAQMPAAIARIFKAFEDGERITVHGDYDADGVTGSTVIITALREVESRLKPIETPSNIDWYIPHRDKEGYGLNPTSVQTLKDRGTNLIITVDCGIANVAEIAQAKALGMDTIVLDHHQFGDELPDGLLIHPKLPGESYPFPHLAAVGVAWKTSCALFAEARRRRLDIPDGAEKWLLDLVSIATVTDMVPMIGENRVLETYGLKVLNKTRRPGLKALIRMAGAEPGLLTTETVGFGLGPRINAAGRMDHALLALELLLAENDEEATVLADKLEACNKERQKATASMMIEAEAQFATQPEAPVVVLRDEKWSPSLVGLVAGKFMDKTGKPTIAIGKNGDRWVGSGRSYAWYDITAAMKRAGEGILTHSGGHVQACGFSFTDTSRAEELADRLRADAAGSVDPSVAVPSLNVDVRVGLEQLDWDLIKDLDRLEPFGEHNRRPIFASMGLNKVAFDTMGQTQKHIRLTLRSDTGRSMKFVGFNMAERLAEIADASKIDVAYELGVNEWNGRREIQCKLVDLRPASG